MLPETPIPWAIEYARVAAAKALAVFRSTTVVVIHNKGLVSRPDVTERLALPNPLAKSLVRH